MQPALLVVVAMLGAAAPAAAQGGAGAKPAPAQSASTKSASTKSASTKPAAKPAANKAAPKPVTAREITSGSQDIPGVSAEGNAILAKLRTAPDPDFAAIIRQQQALGPQIGTALNATTVDVDKVADLLRQGEALRAQAQAKNIDRVIAAAKALPAADQGPFLRAIAVANAARAAGR